jgi:predicted GTPase
MVVSATPIDLTRLVNIDKPILRVYYNYRDNSEPTLGELVMEKLSR